MFKGCNLIFKQLAGVYNHLRWCHLGVAISCYYCSGRWWTHRGWNDHHRKHHNTLSHYPSKYKITALLATKAKCDLSTTDNIPDSEPSEDQGR